MGEVLVLDHPPDVMDHPPDVMDRLPDVLDHPAPETPLLLGITRFITEPSLRSGGI